MQISKMKVGTMYLANKSRDWREDPYNNEAYVLMSTDPYRETRTSSWKPQYGTVTIEDREYSYLGRKWIEGGYKQGGKLYLAQRVNPDTREPILNPCDGKPFLSLVSSRQVRGEWAEALEEQEEFQAEQQEQRQRQREASQQRWNRAEGIAIRLRSLLGLESNSYTVNTTGVAYRSAGGPTSITIGMDQAEALADKLDEANQEIEDLKAELRDLRK